jgi:hypothetical protein
LQIHHDPANLRALGCERDLVAVAVSNYRELEPMCSTTQPAKEHQIVVIFLFSGE